MTSTEKRCTKHQSGNERDDIIKPPKDANDPPLVNGTKESHKHHAQLRAGTPDSGAPQRMRRPRPKTAAHAHSRSTPISPNSKEYDTKAVLQEEDSPGSTPLSSASTYGTISEDDESPGGFGTNLKEILNELEEEETRLTSSGSENKLSTSALQTMLSDLSMALEERQSQSMRLCGDVEEIRLKLENIRGALEDQLNHDIPTGLDENRNVTDNKVSETAALSSLSSARANLARLALEVSQTTQIAAEAEMAAAQAAVMAEEAKHEADSTANVLGSEDSKIAEDDVESTSDSKDLSVEHFPDDSGKDREGEMHHGIEKEETEEYEKEAEQNFNGHEIQETQNGGTSLQTQEKTDNMLGEEEEVISNICVSPSLVPCESERISMESRATVDTPRRTPRESPLKWPYYEYNVPEDPTLLCCMLRSTTDIDDVDPSRSFTCSLAPHLGVTVVDEREELVSEIVQVEIVPSEEDYQDEDFEEEDSEGKDKDDENTHIEDGDDEEIPEDEPDGNESSERMEEDKTEKVIAQPSKEVKVKPVQLVVAIPYLTNPRMSATREFVVKALQDGEEWRVIPSLTIDGSFPDHKGPFAEVRVNRVGAFAVVARLLKDRLTITRKGGVLKATTDNRVTVTYPPGICSLMSMSLQIQPADQAVTELKSRMRHCSDLITASPILRLSHSTQNRFDKPVTVTIPCPPNPLKTGMNSSTRVEKEDKKEDKVSNIPREEGVVVIRSTKSSIFGGDPYVDALHLLQRPVSAKSWCEVEDIRIKQIRKDVVAVDINDPYDNLLVLRTSADARFPIDCIANTFEMALQIKYSKIILVHRLDDPEKILVQCVPARHMESALRKLSADGYEEPTEISPDLPLTEGTEIIMRFVGNVQLVGGGSEVKLTFHSQRRNVLELDIGVANRYGNHSSPEYRGMAEFYGKPRVILSDLEDPEEVLLRQAEEKLAAKKAANEKDEKKNKAKSKTKENKEQSELNGQQPNLLCKLPLILPKSESEQERMSSTSRATPDVEGMVNNENLRWLATELGNEWEILAGYLGITPSRLQSIKRNYPGEQELQVYQMLLTWRSRLPKAYNKERRILKALTRCGRYDLGEELKYRDQDEYSDDSSER